MFDGQLKIETPEVIVQEPVCSLTGLTRSRIYAELAAIADDLEANRLYHFDEETIENAISEDDDWVSEEKNPAPAIFNMNFWQLGVKNVEGHCGSVCCIGGWFDIRTNMSENNGIRYVISRQEILTVDECARLRSLFYEYTEYSCDPTPAEAAAAIRKFLNGKEPWR